MAPVPMVPGRVPALSRVAAAAREEEGEEAGHGSLSESQQCGDKRSHYFSLENNFRVQSRKIVTKYTTRQDRGVAIHMGEII